MYEVNQREFYVIWRRRNKVTLKQVADYIGCSDALICKWERGKCEISDYKLKRYNQFIEIYKK